ncbi:hypothetical protein BGZ99_003109 [Dissophora globulifera]|uniref:ADP-ribosylglycohydrolase n=1 Tax=Dissophora globulifera TaxID=979702 RepID=A0A9P6UVM1_9FUNG|nr:hypothetical protein BGZ99_003109 [Dissophora globulifera]
MSSTHSTLSRDQIKDRILGCLFGNAVGDSYGLATEFMSKKHAQERYGNGPIAFGKDEGYPVWLDSHRSKWARNDFTDDTDQMLLLLQSLQQTRDGRLHATNFAKRLKEWSIIGFPEMGTPPRGIGFTVGSTLTHPEFRYNPHKAAFEARLSLHSTQSTLCDFSIWNSKGRSLAANGAVMRTSVLGVECFWDEPRVVENALAAAKVTHADPRSIVSALIASVLISRLLRGGGQHASQDTTRVWNAQLEHGQYKAQLLEYLQRGTDIRGEQTAEPEYEPETATSVFKNKDERAIAKQRTAAAGSSSPTTAPGGSMATRSFKTGFVDRVTEFVTGGSAARQASDTWNSNRPEVKMRETVGWAGMDGVGADEAMQALAQSVVEDYKFLLLDTDVVPPTINLNNRPPAQTQADGEADVDNVTPAPLPRRIQEKWTKELETSCFPENLGALDLGHAAHMGYTFKCVGSGFYAVTRQLDAAATIEAYKGPTGLFRGIIEQVTLEAGDADTNGAVVGSLLGARFGLKDGIPDSWWPELLHYQWFMDIADQFADRVLAMYQEQEQE